jgi:hypothetical protein
MTENESKKAKKKSTTQTVRIPDEIWEPLRTRMAAHGLKFQGLVLSYLRDYLAGSGIRAQSDINQKGHGSTPEQTDSPKRHEKASPLKNSELTGAVVDSQLFSEIDNTNSLEAVYAYLRTIGAMKTTTGDELGLWGQLTQFVIMSQEPDLSLSLKCNLLMFGKSAVAYERASRPDAPKEEERPDHHGGMEQFREMQAALERDRAELARREEEHRAAAAGLAEREKEFERQIAEIESLQAPLGRRKKGPRRKAS